MDTAELVKTDTAARISQPLELIAEAMTNADIPVDKMRAMFELESDWQEREAKKEFTRAIGKFQHECPTIRKDDQGEKSKYAKLDRIWNTVRPLLKSCGLSIIWSSEKIDSTRDFCILDGELIHTSGHSIPIHSEMAIPEAIKRKVDGKAIQNAAQVIGCAISYCKRYAICGVLGIQTGSDSDGDPWKEPITEQQATELLTLINDADFGADRIDGMLRWAGCDSVQNMPTAKYNGAVQTCKKAIAKLSEATK